MTAVRPHRRRTLAIVLAVVALLAVGIWIARWRLGKAAVTIADPLVRAWVANQVLSSSDSVYHITTSPIKVDETARRISIDSIVLVTDSQRNAQLPIPHPILALRFTACELTGIDLTGLTAGQGLHATHAGCSNVDLIQQTVAQPVATSTTAPQPADSNNFLRFQGKLELPAVVPYVGVDIVAFPHVHVSLDLLGADGKRSAVSVDSLAVELDSVRIDPRVPIASRRPLFSRDINVRLDRFSGTLKDGAKLSLDHLAADLENGTCKLDMVSYEPKPGQRADSLGFAAIRTRHIELTGVRWRTFLLTGAASVGHLGIDTVSLKIVTTPAPKGIRTPAHSPVHLESSLRAVGRFVKLDSMAVKMLTATEINGPADTTFSSLRQLSLGHLEFGADESSWSSDYPVGKLTLTADGFTRHTRAKTTFVSRITLDAAAQRITIDSLRDAPDGDDESFMRRQQFRKARLRLAMSHVDVTGINFAAFMRRGALRARKLDVRDMVIDVLSDKSKPDSPAKVVRRYPQAVMHDAHAEIQVDTVIGTGLVTYRERDSTATTPGTLTFGALKLRGTNFSTDPKRMTTATPFKLVGDAMLMGAGAMHVEWNVPLLSPDFSMDWSGTLGTVDPMVMNSFLPDAVGMRFTGGVFEGAEWHATVRKGLSTGVLSPRWHDLHVELPGVARNDSSMVGGLLRGFAKLAANTFGIRGDNTNTGGKQAMTGSINHQWVPDETLPEFIWKQLREPLLLILKK